MQIGGSMSGMTSALTRPLRRSSRREWIALAGIAGGGVALTATGLWADGDLGVSRTAESIHQEATFKAGPKRIYEILLDADQFQKVQLISFADNPADIVARPAAISREPGGAFSLFGGYISGRQVELASNERIVQAWRAGSWEAGQYSIAKFRLVAQDGGTKLIFDHTGFPPGLGEHLADGWKSHYWIPMGKFLAQ
jgi:activator of HSP90 ATPase